MAMPEQLPQIALLAVRHPDPREPILHHQPQQQQLAVLAIELLGTFHVLQPPLAAIASIGVHKRNLLEAPGW